MSVSQGKCVENKVQLERSESVTDIKVRFSPRRKADVDVFFSVQSAAGSTLLVRQWKMLDPPFSGLSNCPWDDIVAATVVPQ